MLVSQIAPRGRLPARQVTLVEALIFLGGAVAAVFIGALAAAPPL